MKINPKLILDIAIDFCKEHAPGILAGIGIGLSYAAIGFTAKAAPAANKALEKAEKEKGEPLTKTEEVKTVWKYYIPAAACAVGSTGCIVAATRVGDKRIAALTGLYHVTEDNLKELREHSKELLGEQKSNVLLTETAAKKVSDVVVPDGDIIKTRYGDGIFYDPWSARFFTSNPDRVAKAVNAVKLQLTTEDFVQLNDFYYELGLPDTQLGDIAGFTSIPGQQPDVVYGYGPTADGRSCTVLAYDIYLPDAYGDRSQRLFGCDHVK